MYISWEREGDVGMELIQCDNGHFTIFTPQFYNGFTESSHPLQALSSEMDTAEIRFIRWVFIGVRRRSKTFLKGSHRIGDGSIFLKTSAPHS